MGGYRGLERVASLAEGWVRRKNTGGGESPCGDMAESGREEGAVGGVEGRTFNNRFSVLVGRDSDRLYIADIKGSDKEPYQRKERTEE